MSNSTSGTIRRMREQAAVSIRELERRTGINRGRLSVIERGLEPTPDELRNIVTALSGQTAAFGLPSDLAYGYPTTLSGDTTQEEPR